MRKKSTQGRINYQDFKDNVAKYEGKGLNVDEIFEIKEAFDFIDNNDSGSISRKEFSAAKNMMQIGEKEDENVNIFELMLEQSDKDKSGSISFDEFITVFSNIEEQRQDKTTYYRDLFYLFTGEDDSKKKLNIEDMKSIVKKIEEKISDEDLNGMFNRADADKDGLVGVDEFVKFMMSN